MSRGGRATAPAGSLRSPAGALWRLRARADGRAAQPHQMAITWCYGLEGGITGRLAGKTQDCSEKAEVRASPCGGVLRSDSKTAGRRHSVGT